MPKRKEAERRHAFYYSAFAKEHSNEQLTIWRELPNLLPASRFLASGTGEFDRNLVELVTNLQYALETDAYWGLLLPMLRDAQFACDRMGDYTKRAEFILSLAQMHTNLSQYEEALIWLDKAVALAQVTGDVEALADGYRRKGWTSIYLGMFAEALMNLAKSQELARQCNRVGILGSALHFTARAYFEIGDYEQSLKYIHAELRLPPEAHNRGSWAYALLRGAAVLLMLGKIKVAERLTLRSLHEAQSMGTEANVAPFLHGLAQVRWKQGRVEEALDLLNESVGKMGYSRGEMNVRQDMAQLYAQTGQLDKALRLIDEVIEYRTRAKERRHLAAALCTKGKILELQGDVQQSVKFYQEGIDLFENMQCLPTVSREARIAIERLKQCLKKGITHEPKF